MAPATFHFPGQEHQQKPALTSVATGTHTPKAPAVDTAGAQQRRVVALQLAQKQAPDAPVNVLIGNATKLEAYIRTGAEPAGTTHGATAVRP